MPTEANLLEAIARAPDDALAWLALADCLEELGQPERAGLVRLRERLRFAAVDAPHRTADEARLAELLIAGVEPAVPAREIDLGRGVAIAFVLIPAGSFWMGSPDGEDGRWDDEGPRHEVRISKPFWMGRFPVTESQHRRLMRPQSRGKPGPREMPVCHVDWHAAQECCVRLSERASAAARLPTEAEWEYACRAGTAAATYLGDGEDKAALAGWYHDNSAARLHPVGEKVPNAWGLHDMLGNVWNWCADGRRRFTGKKRKDPRGPNANRAIKGASWKSMGFRTRCAARFPYQDRYSFDDLGFRVVLGA